MALEVRGIAADEMEAWVDVTLKAFHGNRSAAEVAAFRRDTDWPTLERTLAALEGERIVGTLESFSAELTLPGSTSITTDAISAVSVLPTHRRRGALTRMITSDLQAARERGEAAAILIPSEYPIYGRFGFGPATTRVEYSIETAAARFTRLAEGSVDFVDPRRLRELAPSMFDRFRRERPGQIDRPPLFWDVRLGLRDSPWRARDKVMRCAIHTSPGGEPDGYLTYTTEESRTNSRFATRMELAELVALSSDAYLGLWRFCCEMDLITEVVAGMRSSEEPLHWLLENPRAAISEKRRSDFLWVRALDTPRLLSCRHYASEDQLVIELEDPLGTAGGRFAVEGGPSGATCQPSQKSADLTLGMTALGAISLGGQSLYTLAEVGLIEEQTPGALARAERFFRWPVAPWCSTGF